MLNIEITDNTIKAVIATIVIAMFVAIVFLLAPSAYKQDEQAAQNSTNEHKVWLAANTNPDADEVVYY